MAEKTERKQMMKALKYILYGLVIAAAAGLLVYQGFVTKDLTTGNLTKAILIIAAAIAGMFRPQKRKKVSNKKALYQKAYGEYIQNAFYDDPKLEKRFYDAVDDYNFDRCAAAIEKLNKLRKECQRTADLHAVTVFTALCCEDMQLHDEAAAHYEAAVRIRDNSSLHSNRAMCLLRAGKPEEAEAALQQAVRLDPKNDSAWNNWAVLCFCQGDYRQALVYYEKAMEIDSRLPQSLGGAAVCCALLGEQAQYESYYRRAVAAGYSGEKIKNTVKAMDPSL